MFFQHVLHEGTSSENSALLTVFLFEPQLSYTYAIVAVLYILC